MEEVDKILIHALRQVGTEVGEDIDRVNQFTSELIVEAVGKCIRVIDPGLGGALPTSLPPGMSARFRVGMSLAQACQVKEVEAARGGDGKKPGEVGSLRVKVPNG
ncbi:Coiled-coil domain-containing protein 22 [Ameca splendens]|uniref:Coiled-coil domain-containing protein 22 n=1 Tax=Ameca splendens TaxID=208324 RepID=A0ABV0Z190_9TELE